MHSPPARSRSSQPTLNNFKTAAALRRGDLKISDPVFVDQDTALGSGWETPSVALVYTRQGSFEDPWPRPSTSSEPHDFHHDASSSSLDVKADASSHTTSQSISGSMSTTQLRASSNPGKGVGIRATLKRVLGSKRHRSVSVQDDQNVPHRVTAPATVSVNILDDPTSDVTDAIHIDNPNTLTPHLHASLPFETQAYPSINTGKPAKTRSRLQRRNSVPNTLGRGTGSQIGQKHITNDSQDRLRSSRSPLLRGGNLPRHISKSAVDLHERAPALPEIPTLPVRHNGHFGLPQLDQHDSSVLQPQRNSDDGGLRIHNPTPLRVHHQQFPTPPVPSMESFDFAFGEADEVSPSLEERVNTLEVKVFDFEYAIARLQGHDIPKPSIQHGPTKQRSIHKLFTKSDTKHAPHPVASSPNLAGTAMTQEPITRSFFDDQSQSTSSSSKATTIRHITRRQSPADDLQRSAASSVRLRFSQYENLMHLIKQEQDARLRMERKIIELQQELDVLKAPVFATIKPLMYPTPSPDSFNEHMNGHRTLHRAPAFQWDRPVQAPQFTSISTLERLSSTDTENNERLHDGFHTPRENQFSFSSAPTSPQVGSL